MKANSNTEIILLIRNVRAEDFGGGESYQLKLAKKLKVFDCTPIIVTNSDGLLRYAKNQEYKVLRPPYISNQNWSGWRNFLFLLYLIKIMRLRRWYKKAFKKYNPSVINIQSRDDWIAATVVAKKLGIKVLWTDHMDMRSWVLTNVNVWYKNIIGKWVLKSAQKADKIIMISDYEKRFFDDVTSNKRLENVEVLKNGVDDEYENFKEDRKKIQEKTFCYVGRIVDYKGIKELIEAFKLVVKKYPEAKLNIYGDGDLDTYKKISEDCDAIKFYGRTEEPLKVLAKNEIFVLPSYREGLSLSLLDAAMMRKKIIASNVDGNPEVVVNGETGLLVPVRNVQKLAEAMIWMLEHKKEAEEMAKKAREKYKAEFDFEKIFKKKMLPLYKN